MPWIALSTVVKTLKTKQLQHSLISVGGPLVCLQMNGCQWMKVTTNVFWQLSVVRRCGRYQRRILQNHMGTIELVIQSLLTRHILAEPSVACCVPGMMRIKSICQVMSVTQTLLKRPDWQEDHRQKERSPPMCYQRNALSATKLTASSDTRGRELVINCARLRLRMEVCKQCLKALNNMLLYD